MKLCCKMEDWFSQALEPFMNSSCDNDAVDAFFEAEKRLNVYDFDSTSKLKYLKKYMSNDNLLRRIQGKCELVNTKRIEQKVASIYSNVYLNDDYQEWFYELADGEKPVADLIADDWDEGGRISYLIEVKFVRKFEGDKSYEGCVRKLKLDCANPNAAFKHALHDAESVLFVVYDEANNKGVLWSASTKNNWVPVCLDITIDLSDIIKWWNFKRNYNF